MEKHSKMVASSGPENKEFEKGIMEKFRGNEDGKDRRGGEERLEKGPGKAVARICKGRLLALFRHCA